MNSFFENKLYVKDLDRSNVFNFINDYFNNKAPVTYEDENFCSIQCFAGVRRSFSNLYCLAKTNINPELTIEEFAYIIITILKTNEKISAFYCHNINKIVFNHKSTYSIYEFGANKSCAKGLMFEDTRTTKGIDEISFNEILQMYNNFNK